MTKDEKKSENLYREVRDILYKLASEKIDTLLQQIKSLVIDTKERLQRVIDLIFEKAIDEPNNSAAYANLCSQLALMQVPVSDKKEGEFVNFRKLLITRCHLEFEKILAYKMLQYVNEKEIEKCTNLHKKKELQLQLEEEERSVERKSVGIICFIAELFKKDMLADSTLIHWLNSLLTNEDDLSLECFCTFLSTIDKELEKRILLQNIIITAKKIVDSKDSIISSRVRFMLQDVIDLHSPKELPSHQYTNLESLNLIQKEVNDKQLNIQAKNTGRYTDDVDSFSQWDLNNFIVNESRMTSQLDSCQSTSSMRCDEFADEPPQVDEPLRSSQMFGQWGRGPDLKTTTQFSLLNICAPLENMGNDIEEQNSLAGSYRSKDPHAKDTSKERNYKHPSYEEGAGLLEDGTTSLPGLVVVGTEVANEQLELKIKNIPNENTHSNVPEAFAQLVSYGYNKVLERSSTTRLKLSGHFAQLIEMDCLPLDSYCVGLEDVLGQAKDLIVERPMIWEHLGEMVAPLLYENTLPMRRLYQSCSVLISQGHAAKLLASTFKLVIAEKGSDYLTSMWQTSKLNLSDFMPEEKVNDFINANKLEFLVGGTNTTFTNEIIYKKLIEFFENDTSFEDIISWLTVNLGDYLKRKQFIRVLATAVFKNSIIRRKLNYNILRKHYDLLTYFVDGTSEYELEVLYALQTYINKLKVPQGLYLLAFTILYDDSVLSHDSFLKWETSEDPAELVGKDVALKQLTSFFGSLKKTDDEELSSEDSL